MTDVKKVADEADTICILHPTVLSNVCTVHASDRKLTESGSAKFFVRENGDTVLQSRGILNDREIRIIQGFIKQNYQEMYLKWAEYSAEGFYNK